MLFWIQQYFHLLLQCKKTLLWESMCLLYESWVPIQHFPLFHRDMASSVFWPGAKCVLLRYLSQILYVWEDTVCDIIHFTPSESTESLTYKTCGHYYHRCTYFPITLITRHLQANLVCVLTNAIISGPSYQEVQWDNMLYTDAIFNWTLDMNNVCTVKPL